MALLFKKNAYHVLGLDIGASQRDIKKRADEIIRFLKIDEEQEYETDLPILKATRTEASVKEAIQKLTSPFKKIKEYFFWFDINDADDKKALGYIKDNKLKDARDIWLEKGSKDSASALVAKKNLAVLICLSLIEEDSQQKLTSSLRLWDEVINSDRFWTHFTKIYELNDDTGASHSTIEEFRNNVVNDLSDFYTDLSRKHGSTYYSEFAKRFAAKGQRIQQDVLDPIYEVINDTSEALRSLNISEDQIISDNEVKDLKRLATTLSENFNKLKELGLYDDSRSKTMRDKAAEAIRVVALDLYNNLNESAKPAALLNMAVKLAGTGGLASKLNGDIAQMRENISNEKIIIPINNLIEAEKFEDALQKSESLAEKHSKSKDLLDFFHSRIRLCVTAIAMRDYTAANKEFENKHEETAAQQFISVRNFIQQYLQYFDYNHKGVQEFIEELETRVANMDITKASQIDEYRNNAVNSFRETFGDEQFEGTLLIILMDCYIYAAVAEIIPKLRRKKMIKNVLWVIGIGVIILISALSSGSDSSTSTGGSGSSNSAYNQCVAEYNSLKSQLSSVEASMNSYNAAGDIDNYNALVPQQNNLVREGNAKATECNNLR